MSDLPFNYREICDRVGMPVAAVVFGVGEAQGLAVLRGLGFAGIPVYGIGKEKSVGFVSRFVRETRVVPDTHLEPEGVMNVVFDLGKQLKAEGIKAVLIPTQDSMVELLSKNKSALQEYFVCHLLEPSAISACSDKQIQYQTAERLGVPYPKTYFEHETARLLADIDNRRVEFPLIFKARKELPRAIRKQYRLIILKSRQEVEKLLPIVAGLKIPFIISEVIPGEDDALYTLGCCMGKNGEMLGTFTGRKLRQRPPRFGEARVAESKLVETIIEDGTKLLRGLDYFGIAQVEFKFDARDGKYKLIEVNPRAWSWIGLPIAMGINLPYAFFCDALGINIPPQKMTDRRCVYIYFYEDLYWSMKAKDGKPWSHCFQHYEMIVEPFFNKRDLRPGLLFYARCAGILLKAVLGKLFKTRSEK